ncbi:MAG: PAS domain-containing protein [Sulfurimonas sp.]
MKITPINNEKTFHSNVLLVTKTDTKGIITYANRGFMNIVGMDEGILVGSPHNIIRHPDMPKIIFKYLWDYIQGGREIHAYVKNICADGSYYWVLANVTPSYDSQSSKLIGFHSARRLPTKAALEIIKPLYAKLLQAEKRGGINASEKIITDLLKEKGMSYDEFIISF